MHDTKKFFSIEKNNLILISYSSWFMNAKVVSFGSTFTREKILSVFCYILNNSQFLLWYPRWNRLPERWQHDEVHDDDGEDWDGVAGDEETHVEPDEVVVVDVEGANVGVCKEKTCLIKLISNKCLSVSVTDCCPLGGCCVWARAGCWRGGWGARWPGSDTSRWPPSSWWGRTPGTPPPGIWTWLILTVLS